MMDQKWNLGNQEELIFLWIKIETVILRWKMYIEQMLK